MEQFIWFLGRFHVLVLHLPLGILTLAAIFEVVARFRSFHSLRPVLAPLWVAGALSAVATVVLGYMHATESAFQDLPAVEAHRWAGVWLCVVACIGAVLRSRWPRVQERLWFVPVTALVALMVVTGHLGGNLTHGDTYLVQYAPGPIRTLAGLSAAAPRPRPTDLAAADIFLDVVHPALTQRCGTCHNDSKRSGGLSVVSYERLMEGGESGPVVKPGDAAGSELFHRVTLQPAAEEFMPKDGKTPLTPDQVTALGWWIEQGAAATALIGSMELSADAAVALPSILGLEGGSPPATEPSSGSLPEVAPADEAVVDAVVANGFIVRRVSQDSNLLDVDYASARPLTAEAMADLAKLAPHILRLNLRDAGVGDAEVKIIAGFANLRQLRLEQNEITDAGAADIAKLASLTTLNLTGTQVTDKGFGELARLPNLEILYVWATPVTAAAVKSVALERKDLRVVAGLRPSDVPPPEKVVPPDA